MVFETVEEMDVSLSVKNEVEERKNLQLFDVDYRAETLGVCLVPYGNINDEIRKLNKKIKKWISIVQSKRLGSEKTILCM